MRAVAPSFPTKSTLIPVVRSSSNLLVSPEAAAEMKSSEAIVGAAQSPRTMHAAVKIRITNRIFP
jgi:hypothetical protein